MSARTRALSLTVALAIAGCASPYKTEGFGGGFSETQLEKNVFRVSFRGNGFTSPERAEEFALLRSAELTIDHGYTHFAFIDSRSRESQSAYTTPTQYVTTANANVIGNSIYGTARTTTYGGQTFVISKPSTTNTIMCFSGKPDIQGVVFDARLLCDSLGQKHGVTCRASDSRAPRSIATAPATPLTASPQNNQTPLAVPTEASQPTTITSKDGSLKLTLPAGWIQTEPQQSNIQITAKNPNKDLLVLVGSVNANDIQDLDDFASAKRAGMMNSKLTETSSSELRRTTINGNDGVRFEMSGVTGGVRVHYLVTYVRIDKIVVSVVAWTLESKFSENRPELEQLAFGIQG